MRRRIPAGKPRWRASTAVFVSAWFAGTGAAAGTAAAQGVAAAAALSGVPALAECTYRTCALWRSGSEVLAGAEGTEVGSFGMFDSPDLRPLIELSDSAAYHFAVVERNYASGSFMSFFGLLSYFGGFALIQGKRETDARIIGSILAGAGLTAGLIGRRRMTRADGAMNRSIWWHNEALATDGTVPAPLSPRSQALMRGDHGRPGAVFGTLIGLGVGLAVSSRDSSISVGQGLGETLLFGAGGGLLGYWIGTSARR